MLSQDELNRILSIIDKQVAVFIGTTIGSQGLTDSEKEILTRNGIDYEKLYSQGNDLVALNYQLGLLSKILTTAQMESFDYNSLAKYIQSGNYVPLNREEKAVVDSIKRQSLADIRDSKGKIFRDINNVAQGQFATSRQNQEEFIRGKIKEGVEARKSRKDIAREIARLTGDWSRNFTKSVSYISHTAFNEGRAAIIEKKDGKDAKVWFRVQDDACQSCIRAYLTKGAGSPPKIFTLSEIIGNGTNIGRKQADWLPTLGAMHPHCRCMIQQAAVEREEKKSDKPKVERPKIRVYINGKEAWV
jgi:hypothetical protein